jgi:O-acetyl-ADP-ribose deacetylase (regulator of RNase III)
MLHFIHTSILESQAQTVVNTVNTVGVMGKGLAHAFREKYPSMFNSYKELCNRKQFDVGQLWLWRGSNQWVLNFPTKKHWRYPSKLEYIESGLEKFVANYEARGIREISFPRLGCGNGGLQWEEVRPVMEKYLSPLPIPIYIHDFDADIGAPEHKLALLGKPYRRSFDALLKDLHALCIESNGVFNTISEKKPFLAKMLDDGGVNFHDDQKNCDIDVTSDELYEAWFMLINGPLSESRLVGEARSAASYLLGLFASLPYARAVQLVDKNSVRSIAIELSDDLSAEDLLIILE